MPELQINHYGRTQFKEFLDNMKRFGRRSYRNSEAIPSIYRKFAKTKLFVPLVFVVKLVARTRTAIKAKKLCIFALSLPLIAIGILVFCKGFYEERNDLKDLSTLDKVG